MGWAWAWAWAWTWPRIDLGFQPVGYVCNWIVQELKSLSNSSDFPLGHVLYQAELKQNGSWSWKVQFNTKTECLNFPRMNVHPAERSDLQDGSRCARVQMSGTPLR